MNVILVFQGFQDHSFYTTLVSFFNRVAGGNIFSLHRLWKIKGQCTVSPDSALKTMYKIISELISQVKMETIKKNGSLHFAPQSPYILG